MRLRDFLYLNRPLVRDFLAQLEGGNVDELKETQANVGKKGLAGKIGTSGTGVSGNMGREQSLETEAVLQQTAASELDRLVSYLEDDGLRIVDMSESADDLAEVRRGEIIELDGRVRDSGLKQLFGVLSAATGVLPLLESLGQSPAIDSNALDGLKAVAALDSQSKTVPVTLTVRGGAGLAVALELDPAFTKIQDWDVDATALVKVQRVLRPEESHLVGDPLGGVLKSVPAADRAKLRDSIMSPQAAQFGVTGDIEIRYPGVVATPIAIYR